MNNSDNKIIFIDKNRSTIITLEDFVYSESAIQIFDYKLTISYEFFHAETNIDCEVSDLMMLSEHLRLFFKGGPKACHFIPDISSHFSIHFYIDDFGIITRSEEHT